MENVVISIGGIDMVLYFSGTGNSHFVAEMISEETKDTLLSINERLKGNISSEINSDKPMTLVFPVYAGRIPRVVEKHIRSVSFRGNKNVYFVATCAGRPWDTQKYIKKLCKEKGFNLMGFSSVPMPQNYIAMNEIGTKKENEEIVNIAIPLIKKIARQIEAMKPLEREVSGNTIVSTVLNPILYLT